MIETAFTYWRSCEDPQGVRHHAPLRRVFERFRVPLVRAPKASLPGVAPATFKNDYRNLANFERAFGVCLDVENGATTFEGTCALWASFWCFVHTTYSHTPDAHRLRVIFPTSRPVVEGEYRRVRRWLAARSNEAGQCVDPRPCDPSRLWFVPGIPPGAEYRCLEIAGAVLDVDAVLEEEPSDEHDKITLAPVVPIAATTSTIERARRYLDKCDVAISGSHGHTTTFLVASKLVRGFRLDEETAYALLTSWNRRCKPPWSARDLRRKVREAARVGRFPSGALLEARRRHGG